MAVLKEYRCSDCNRIFDSQVPVCIHCGSTSVARVFVTPFGFKSDRTKFSDDNLQHLADSYGLDDYSNNESTKHTPTQENRWMPVNSKATLETGVVDPNDLQRMATGSFPVKEIKGRAAGSYTAEYHKEDKVGSS